MSDEPMAPRWRKSSASVLSDCVEVASSENLVLIRDSAGKPDAVLELPHREWRSFIGRIVTHRLPRHAESG